MSLLWIRKTKTEETFEEHFRVTMAITLLRSQVYQGYFLRICIYRKLKLTPRQRDIK